MKNYYDILGISEDEKRLSGNEFSELCKKKYHALALKYHPDRFANASEKERKEAEEKFKDIAEANEILSDPNKRARYDNGGSDFNFDGFDPMEMFKRMSGMGGFDDDPFAEFFGRGRQRMNKGSDIHADINITIEEAYKGGKKEVRVQREKKCSKCNGTGSSDGKSHICTVCNGSGMQTEMKQFGPGQFSMTQRPCQHCGGTGKNMNVYPCRHCNGTGKELDYTTEYVEFPRGVDNGMAFRVEGKGNAPEVNGINGDLIVHVNIVKDGYFERPDNLNVIHYETVPFAKALLGFTKEFKCVDGSKVTVNAHELTKPGEAYIFKGKGMPDVMGRSKGNGDYAVVINYELPSKLTEKQKEMLRNFYK